MAEVDDYLDAASIVRKFLGSAEVTKYWNHPSALQEWTVAGLVGHLARPVLNLQTIIEAEVPADLPLTSAIGYFTRIPKSANKLDSAAAVAIRERGVESAGTGVRDLLKRYDAALEWLTEKLPARPAEQEIFALGARMLLSQYLITRMVELLVHTDDLAVSVERKYPSFSIGATDAVIATQACVSARTNSPTDLIRALARNERALKSVSAF